MRLIFIASLALSFHSVAGREAVADPLAIGLEGDLPTAYLGSRAPSGMLAATGAVFAGPVGARLALGFSGSWNAALSLEGNGLLLQLDRFSVDPIAGVSAIYDHHYQVMTGDSRVGSNGEHFETYRVANDALSLNGFAGVRASTPRTRTVVYSLQAGYVRELQFTADDLHVEEIRNCYYDECPDSDESGGGAHPNPRNAYFVGFGVEWILGR